ncbi:putative negative regulator of RcsB-dependent stress response [Nitrosomonas sp. Nm84]|uniref:tetratricopeptide repeat protein n=1 Tax=Nitrosomonas sp. Nm84 TaxID=200124 RepID=UPI000D772C7A|nr:tetratricopeptide repeat protein [Nitrosomonas sp. Nm84]PXW91347.1 putative negative regulator of RcsB-dependent stress response [Nitrosomonas sp. Nm84]
MATYNLEEQEKIDGFKTWWDKYGNAITILLTAFLVTLGGAQAWKYYQQKQAHQAADLYILLQQVKTSGGDAAKINDAAQLLTTGFPSSGYAPRAALITAQADVEAGNNKRAIQNLQWIIDHAKEATMHDLARLRIAGILLDEEKYDEALRILDTQHGEAFAGLYLDRKGDILTAAKKISEARLSYQAAIDKLSKNNNYYNIVQMKLDALGDSD